MEENIVEAAEPAPKNTNNDNQKQIVSAIIVAGMLIAGAILLKGHTAPPAGNLTPGSGAPLTATMPAPVGALDQVLGNTLTAKATLIMYEDFQCPYCGRFFSDSENNIRDTYVKNGDLALVYRDYAFLGPESTRAAEAARCAAVQGKFWEYHDYLFNHQNGENKGNFSDTNLKSFARDLGLNTVAFNKCLDSGTYAKAVADSTAEGGSAGVSGTPKGFLVTKKDISNIMQDEIIKSLAAFPNSADAVSFYKTKNIVSLNGALPWMMVKPILDILLK